MKNIILLLFVFVVSLKAEVHSILVEPVAGTTSYRVTSYGELADGKPSVKIASSFDDVKLINDFKDNASLGGSKACKRIWIYFHIEDIKDLDGNLINAKGSIRTIDFHLEPAPDFESKIFNSADIDAATKIETFKSSLETK